MTPVDKTELYEASSEIVLNNQSDEYFDSQCLVPHGKNLQALLLSMTNVHMVPGENGPPLQKVSLSHPEASLDLTSTSNLLIAARVKEQTKALSDTDSFQVADAIKATCEDIKPFQEDNPDNTFNTIAVLAIFGTVKGPLAYAFFSKSFADGLTEYITDLNDSDIDNVLSEEHARRAEHNLDIQSFDEWRDEKLEKFSLYSKDQTRLKIAQTMMLLLLLPSEQTRPAFNNILFDKLPQ